MNYGIKKINTKPKRYKELFGEKYSEKDILKSPNFIVAEKTDKQNIKEYVVYKKGKFIDNIIETFPTKLQAMNYLRLRELGKKKHLNIFD